MPIYEYACPSCDYRFELRRSFSEADAATTCPKCNHGARRLLSKFACFCKGSDGETASIAGTGSSCSSCGGGNCSSCH
jgi:putative FmdB family regulatory protein